MSQTQSKKHKPHAANQLTVENSKELCMDSKDTENVLNVVDLEKEGLDFHAYLTQVDVSLFSKILEAYTKVLTQVDMTLECNTQDVDKRGFYIRALTSYYASARLSVFIQGKQNKFDISVNKDGLTKTLKNISAYTSLEKVIIKKYTVEDQIQIQVFTSQFNQSCLLPLVQDTSNEEEKNKLLKIDLAHTICFNDIKDLNTLVQSQSAQDITFELLTTTSTSSSSVTMKENSGGNNNDDDDQSENDTYLFKVILHTDCNTTLTRNYLSKKHNQPKEYTDKKNQFPVEFQTKNDNEEDEQASNLVYNITSHQQQQQLQLPDESKFVSLCKEKYNIENIQKYLNAFKDLSVSFKFVQISQNTQYKPLLLFCKMADNSYCGLVLPPIAETET